ncbi:MAG: arylsulfatase, partial [Verrucomicrobiota bacterium]|nr:arylsulfatase [Verrucomicrobiota bacterium]
TEPICQTDLLATFAAILDKPIPARSGEDSISFHGAWGRAKSTHPSRPPVIHHAANGRFAIRTGKWKLIMESTKKAENRELYNLHLDVGEKNNVLADHGEVEKALLARLSGIVTGGATRDEVASKNDTPLWADLVWLPR